MTRFLFVGESPSARAKKFGYTWTSGRLSGKQLFDALRAAGIDPAEQQFINLFTGPACRVNQEALGRLHAPGVPVVAMGRKVEKALVAHGVAHTFLTHPAARGKVRRKDNYARHVRATLRRVK